MFKYYDDLKGIKTADGRTIKEGMLIRGTTLTDITEAETSYINSLHLKMMLDLRHPEEIKIYPDPLFEGCTYRHISMIDNDISGIIHVRSVKGKLENLRRMDTIQKTYEDMFTLEYPLSKIRETIRTIVLEDVVPCYYHCVSGKDRTGITTVLLLYILGCDRKTIDEAYLKIRPVYIRHAWFLFFITFFASFSLRLAIKAKDMYTIKKEYVDIIYDTISKNFGSMDNFITDFIGLNNKEISDFRAKILE